MLLKPHISKLISRYELYTEGELLFESDVAGSYEMNVGKDGLYEVTVVAGGANGYNVFLGEGVYTHAATGGSGSAFVGEIPIVKGKYPITVGGVAQNSTAIGVTAYAGVTAVYNSGGGAGGALPTIPNNVVKTTLHKAGNKGAYGRGGDGGDPAWIVGRTPSVYQPNLNRNEGTSRYTWRNTNYGYGAGCSCYTQEYYRASLPAIGGYVKVAYVRPLCTYIFEIRPNPSNAKVIINNIETNRLSALEGVTINYNVSLDGYKTVTGSVLSTKDQTLNITLSLIE